MKGIQKQSLIYPMIIESLWRRWRPYRKAVKRCRLTAKEVPVHQLRTSIRRLSAVLELLEATQKGRCGSGKVLEQLKCELDALRKLRDLQVCLRAVALAPRKTPGLRKLQEQLESRAIRRALRTERMLAKKTHLLKQREAIEDLARSLSPGRRGRVPDAAAKRLAMRELMRRRRRFSEAIKPALAGGREPELVHKARVRFKHFRYIYEELAPLSGKRSRAPVFRHFQEVLGRVQDASVLLTELENFREKNPALRSDPGLTSLIEAQKLVRANAMKAFQCAGPAVLRSRAIAAGRRG
jgi:CHAD domain-containing protein